MWADAKADAFVSRFPGLWLRTANVTISKQPAEEIFPDWDASLQAAMEGETSRFMRDMITGDVDFLSWQVATNAMYQQGGEAWQTWKDALEAALLPHQRTDGAHVGSWDPIDRRGRECGRVYATAVNALALSCGYRYAAVVRRAAPGAPK